MIFVLKSISLPVILMVVIEFAIFLNMGISTYTNTTLPFIASIVIGTIQLGATIDYAILITTKYIIDNGNEIPLERDNATIENTVLHKDNTNPINIRVYIKWDDSNEATMDNDADTEATKQVDNPAKMDVKLSFIQLK